MHKRDIPPKWANLESRYKSVGGVLDYFLLESDPADKDPVALHRAAALATMEHVRAKYSHWAGFVHVYPEKAIVREITMQEFLGPCYDSETNSIKVLIGYEPPENDFEQPDAGYAYAFGAPPYGLLIPAEERNALFTEVSTAAFGGFSADIQIYRWSDEISSYFTAGRDWWGCYFWTVYNPETKMLAGIAGSTSD